jgi:hypothetical protein
MGWFRHVHVSVWGVAVLRVPTRAGASQPINIHPNSSAPSSSARYPATTSLAEPHTATAILQTSRPNPMPIATLLRRTPLHPSSTSTTPRILAFVPSSLILSHARTMTTKPSLAAAEDFLSFVNASPTRMSLVVAPICIIVDQTSFPCRQVRQREARESWLQANQGMSLTKAG